MLKIHGKAASRLEKEQIMRRLFTVTAMLVLLAPAIGCESCLFRGERAQPVRPPVFRLASLLGPDCPGCAPAGGCSSCGAPTISVRNDARPGRLIAGPRDTRSSKEYPVRQVRPGRFRHPERNRLGRTVLFSWLFRLDALRGKK